VNSKLELGRASQTGKKHQKQEALLLNLIRCGECGAVLVLTYTKRHGKRHHYYVCPKARRREGCKQPALARQDIEGLVIKQLEIALGAQPSRIILQQAVEQIVYNGSTREVAITQRDGSRIECSLPIPNRRGVRSRAVSADGRIPRISRLMALAIKMQKLIREGPTSDYAELASLGSVSRARMTQIMSLTNLAPEIQEKLLFLPNTISGPDPITERGLSRIVQEIDWAAQIKLFRGLNG